MVTSTTNDRDVVEVEQLIVHLQAVVAKRHQSLHVLDADDVGVHVACGGRPRSQR